ncbi:MAG: DeoR/GlpR family DNA-binding transcription regulator [Pseudoruegeria sp.]
MPDNRHSKLLMLLLSQGQMSVQDISASLKASLATVRRDLLELERLGHIERLHGSARIATGSHRELAFSAREQNQIAAKRAIASQAAKLIQPNESVFLDAGTTVLQLARHIRSIEMPINVFTNGLVIAQELAHVSNVSVTLIGGRVRAENQSMVGPAAISMLEGLWFDWLFLGATSIDDKGNLTSVDADEAATNAQMIKRCKELVVLADTSKFGRKSTFAVDRLKQGDLLITNAAPEGKFAQYLKSTGVGVMLAQVATHG